MRMNFRILYTVPDDYPELWERWTRRFRGRGSRKRVKALAVADKALVVCYVLMYLLIGWGSAHATPSGLIAYVASTALCFFLLSAYRSWRNEPRPYEAFDMKPLVPKKRESHGKSFPSRHAFCAFLIATLTAAIFRPFGWLAFVFAALLGVIRVLEGVHFPRDIFAAAVAGIAGGAFCIAAMLVAIG